MVQVRAAKIRFRAGVMGLLAAVALTAVGCSGFGGSKDKQQPAPDANVFPDTYRAQLTGFIRQSLTDRADYHGALIAPPVLKPVGSSPHYVVCIQFNGRSQIKNKVAIFLGGQMTQFIDSTPEQCADAAYQPFKELENATPSNREESAPVYRG
jgi:hypothetical protein